MRALRHFLHSAQSLLLLLLLLALPAGPVRAAPLVTNCNDAGLGSLRAAITAASGGTIQFQAGLNCPSASPILLTSGTLTIATNLTIDGTGATIAVDGDNAGSVFTVNSGTTVTINALTIQHGQQVGGGGINNQGTLTVTNSTLSGNSAPAGGGGIYYDQATVTLTNVIVANSAGGDFSSGFGSALGGNNNLIDDAASAGGFMDGVGGNIVGHPALLGPLGNYGGPTQTVPLLSGSPAINAGATVGSGPATNRVPATDQRGLPRVGAPDIGAFESQGSSTITLNPATLPNGMQGTPYNQTITASGGGAPYSFAVTSGTLPPGLMLTTTGTLSGTPTSAGSFAFTVTATDHLGVIGSHAYTLVVTAAPNPLPKPRPGGGAGGGPPNAQPAPRPTVPVVGVPNPVPSRRP